MEAIIPSLITAISGPASATVIMALLMAGAGYGFFMYGLPSIERMFKTQREALDNILSEHKSSMKMILDAHEQDRIAFSDGMKDLGHSIEKLSERIEDIEDEIRKKP